ncbi:MAG: hypothetical protein EOO88_17375, partial [Pedobacter sp.]
MCIKTLVSRTIFTLLAIASFSATSQAQAQDLAYAKAVVKKLASPAFKGRGYVGGGDQIASAYIADAYKRSGLVPLNNGSYFQDYKLSVNTFPGKVEVKLNGTLLQTGKDYLIGATSPSVHGTFKVIPVKRADINT